MTVRRVDGVNHRSLGGRPYSAEDGRGGIEQTRSVCDVRYARECVSGVRNHEAGVGFEPSRDSIRSSRRVRVPFRFARRVRSSQNGRGGIQLSRVLPGVRPIRAVPGGLPRSVLARSLRSRAPLPTALSRFLPGARQRRVPGGHSTAGGNHRPGLLGPQRIARLVHEPGPQGTRYCRMVIQDRASAVVNPL